MEQFGDFFPGNPQTLDELLEQMAEQMAAMQAMLNSMTPEQRAQLQGLANQLLEDMDLRWQVDRLSNNLRGAFPGAGWDRRYNFSGNDPLGFAEAASLMDQLGDIDQLENLLQSAGSPGALADVDLDKARELLGDDGARSLERLAELTKMLGGGRAHRAARGPLRADAEGHAQDRRQRPRRPVQQAGQGPHGQAPDRPGGRRPRADLRDQALRVRRPVQPQHRAHRAQRHPPQRRGHAGAAVTRRLRGRAHRDVDPVVDRADARPVAVDADARQLPGRQEGGDGAALADLHAVPARLPRHRRLQRGGPRAQARAAARGVVGLRLRHQHAARLPAQPAHAGPSDGHQADHHDHRRRADGPHPRRRRCRSSTTRRCRRRSTPR